MKLINEISLNKLDKIGATNNKYIISDSMFM